MRAWVRQCVCLGASEYYLDYFFLSEGNDYCWVTTQQVQHVLQIKSSTLPFSSPDLGFLAFWGVFIKKSVLRYHKCLFGMEGFSL